MKYSCSVEINAPLAKVVSLWENEENFKEWQDGFVSYTPLSGSPNKPGAKSKIVLEDRQRIELVETIISVNLPEEKTAEYFHKHMTNTQTSRFKALDKNNTLYISEVEYTKFNGLLIKLMARLFPGKFEQQSQKWMDQFKAFVEGN